MVRPSIVKALTVKATPLDARSALADALLQFRGAQAIGAALPRDDRLFGGSFAPLNPIAPVPLDPASPSGLAEPRRMQYPQGYNLATAPGANKLIDFEALRNLADLHGITRRCIEIRKQELASLDWEISPRAKKKSDARAIADRLGPDIEAIENFLHYPDAIAGRRWGSWLKALLEEVFVVDALSVYLHPTWAPGFGPLASSVSALEVLDGTTIKPLIDVRGARPLPPYPAFQQYLFGFPRSEFTALQEMVDRGASGEEIAKAADELEAASGLKTTFRTDQLIYKPYNERSWTPYGFPPTEQVVLAINLALKREAWHLNYFTDGTVPAGLIHAPEEWTPAQIEEYQGAFDALMAGDPTWKHRIKVVPGAEKYEAIKPVAHDMDFDEFLVRVVCLGFDVMPEEIGFPPQGGLGGKGWSEGMSAIARRKSVVPLMRWLKDEILDPIIATQFGRPELQFRWHDLDDDDGKEQDDIDHARLGDGRMRLNEWRIEHDLDPYPTAQYPEADEPFIITATGPVFLRGALQKAEDAHALQQQQGEAAVETTLNPPVDPNKKAATDGLARKASTAQANKAAELRSWRRKALRSLKDGKGAGVRFTTQHLTTDEAGRIRAELTKATTADAVAAAFPTDVIDTAGRPREENHHPDFVTAAGQQLEDAFRSFSEHAFSRRAAAFDADPDNPLPSTAAAEKLVKLIDDTRAEFRAAFAHRGGGE